jgi:transcription initiation factor IIE alpha subunit
MNIDTRYALMMVAALSLVSTLISQVFKALLDEWIAQYKEEKEQKKHLSQSIIRSGSDYSNPQIQKCTFKICKNCKNRFDLRD